MHSLFDMFSALAVQVDVMQVMGDGSVDGVTRGATRGELYDEVQSTETPVSTASNIGDIGADVDGVGTYNIRATCGDWKTFPHVSITFENGSTMVERLRNQRSDSRAKRGSGGMR